jgi:hypothetical protein
MLRRFDHPRVTNRWLRAIHLLLLLASTWLATAALAEEASDSAKPPKLFSSEDTLELTISAPWNDLERDERFQGAYPAQVRYQDAAGNTVVLDATVERRGVKRQQVCDFPPIRIRFDKEVVKGTTFRGQDSLKLVTHCDKASKYDQYYILEMIAYRMYNLLTDYSFRVRPLQISYVDSERDKAIDNRFAFLIEDDSDVAKRHDLKKIRIPKANPRKLEPKVNSLMSLYQFMIGNVDWASLRGPDPEECCHNVKLIGPEPLTDDDYVIPVPYDFDSAGLINAPYAAPPDGLPIRKVTQRLYRGLCMNNDTLEAARQQIVGQEAAIMALIEGDERLNSSSKGKATRYLEEFFEIAKDPKDFDKYVVSKCRG